MPQKTVLIPELGEIILVKRRASKHLRLSVTTSGQVRVSMPTWVPYTTGIRFAKTRSEWLKNQLGNHESKLLEHGDRIGKSHRLEFITAERDKLSTRVTKTQVIIRSGLPLASPIVQKKACEAAERALQQQANHLLPQRLALLAHKYGYSYKSDRVRKLTSRWGSCSSQKAITLSYFLIQLPWHLIDYVLVHELAHTRHMNHSQQFWDDVAGNIPNYKEMRKEIKSYKPSLQIGTVVS